MFEKISRPFLFLYLTGLAISFPYFNWKYANQHGFFSWLAFGEVVATLDATVWPYYAIRSIVTRDSASDDHLETSVEIALLDPNHSDAIAVVRECFRPVKNHLREQYPGYNIHDDMNMWEVFMVGSDEYHCRAMTFNRQNAEAVEMKVIECDAHMSSDGNIRVISISVLDTSEAMRSKWDAISDYYRNERPDLILR